MKGTAEERFWAKVNRTDTCWLWTAALKGKGYPDFWGGGNGYAHRYSYELHYGPIPLGMEIDHVCGVKHCVNPEHLRLATSSQNKENLRKSGRGIYWCKRSSRWFVRVTKDYVLHDGGRFDSYEEAEQAAIALRNKLFTHNVMDRV